VIREDMLRVFSSFESEGLEYVLIGATAMGFHGLIRATEDVDLLIRATEANIERLRKAFRKAYADDPHIDEIKAVDLLGDYPVLRYYPPSGDLFFDVMTRLGEAASFEPSRPRSGMCRAFACASPRQKRFTG
jgi:Nucleotidyl transferase AbiEii toxin, Type IV TA system